MTQTGFTPEWVKHSVFYQIFPDRFAASSQVSKPGNLEAWNSTPTVHGFKGGDLYGVTEKLDYLKDLGITAIYFNPIFQSASNHRYHTHDYFRVDPLLGGDKALQTLLRQAHSRNIRVILDGVFNHASRGFFQFHHILECGAQSPYIDWFKVSGFPLNPYSGRHNYAAWADLPALPKFNTENPEVKKFIFEVARYWIDQGIDGWRLDVPTEIDDDAFWQEFRNVVKSANPEAYIVGEVVQEAQRWLGGDQFDAVMNYQFTQACLAFFGGPHINQQLEPGFMGLEPTPRWNAVEFSKGVTRLLQLYPPSIVQAQFNLLSSHDMPRFFSLCQHHLGAFKLAVLFQMTYPGAPCIYYGEEIGMRNGPRRIPEDARYAFPWDETAWNEELRDHYRQCIALRHHHPVLCTGDFIPLYAAGNQFAYLRQDSEDTILVILNNSSEYASVELASRTVAISQQIEILYGEQEPARSDAGLKFTNLAPYTGIVAHLKP